MIQARKRFGQNFLHDRHVIHQIIDAIDPKSRSHIVEIGPGRGALTFPLLEHATHFTAIEIDRDLIALLKEKTSKPFELIEGDALKIDFRLIPQEQSDSALTKGAENAPLGKGGQRRQSQGGFEAAPATTDRPKSLSPYGTAPLSREPKKLTVIGNLPYNISTPILFHLLSFRDVINEMFFMLQKEVVDRMAAEPGNKDYGRLSVMVQYFCEVEPLFLVPPESFTPAPKVDSMIVRLKPYQKSPYGDIKNFTRFETIVQLAFNQRRKTLRNALRTAEVILPETLASKRAEELSIQDFVLLANS